MNPCSLGKGTPRGSGGESGPGEGEAVGALPKGPCLLCFQNEDCFIVVFHILRVRRAHRADMQESIEKKVSHLKCPHPDILVNILNILPDIFPSCSLSAHTHHTHARTTFYINAIRMRVLFRNLFFID